MKLIISVFLLIFFLSGFSQTKREKFIDVYAGGNVKLTYQATIDLDKKDTTWGAYLIFQNAKYTSITDTKVIALYDKETINQFLKDLISAFKQMNLGEKVSLSWARDKYILNLYDFSKDLYLQESKGTGGYIPMSKKNVGDLIIQISTIDFGSPVLLPIKTVDELIQ